MINVIVGVFLVLHGFVHLLYFGQSAKLFELKPGMIWPEGSWAFSKLLQNKTARTLVSISLIMAAVCFIIGGIGILFSQAWCRPVVVGAATFSSLVYILSWNGKMQNLDGQGVIGILIDMAIILSMLVFRWPAIG
jgi:hypothetical protein